MAGEMHPSGSSEISDEDFAQTLRSADMPKGMVDSVVRRTPPEVRHLWDTEPASIVSDISDEELEQTAL